MIAQNGHFHADTVYAPMSAKHFWYLLMSMVVAKIKGGKSVNAHLPLEIMYPKIYKNISLALLLIRFGEWLKKILAIKLFWENAPLLNYGSWELKHGVMEWRLVPKNIDLCLDTGHLMLGSDGVREARERIREVLKEWGGQIKHLHIHENDLIHDDHLQTRKILDERLLSELKKGRSYIYEKGS